MALSSVLEAPFHAIDVLARNWKLMLLLEGGCHSTVVAPHLPSGKSSGKKLALERDNSAFPVF